MPSPGRISQSTEDADAAGQRLAELSHKLSKGELPIIPDSHKNRGRLQNIRFSSMVMLGCKAASAQSRLKAVSHLNVLRINLTLANQDITLSTSGCKHAMVMCLLRAMWTINRSSA